MVSGRRSILSTCVCLVLGAASFVAGAAEPWMYPVDHAPHAESAEDIAARERLLETAWKEYFARLDRLVKDAKGKDFLEFVRKTSSRDLMVLVNDYGYEALREPCLAKAEKEYLKQIALAGKVLENKGIRDIGDVANLNNAMREAVVLKEAGRFTDELSAPLEAILQRHVETKAIFWGFTKKFPYFMSGYNKECITMEVASNTKLLYAGTGKFPHAIDAFDAAWSQMTLHAYELDNAPHYDSSVNLHIVLRWGMLHGRMDEIRAAPHFRMMFERMSRMALPNGEHANFGKSMAVFRTETIDGEVVDDLFVNGGGLGTMMRWAYRFYGEPRFLSIGRKYELTNSRGKAPVILMPKAYDLNFFEVKQARLPDDYPLCTTTLRLKGRGNALDRGIRRAAIEPVPDKLVLATGSHPRSPAVLMDLSYTQSKAMAERRIGIDNHLFNGTHTVTIVGRPPEPERTNRVVIRPRQPGPAVAKSAYRIRDSFVTRVDADLAYGEVEYECFQQEGVHARRRMALVNNGVLVVEDSVWTDEASAGGMQATALYNVWSRAIDKGGTWALSAPHRGHMPDGRNPGVSHALVCLAPAGDEAVTLQEGRTHDTLQATAPLATGRVTRFLSAVIPLPHDGIARRTAAITSGMRAVFGDAGSSLRLPYAEGQALVVTFPGEPGATAEWKLEGAPGRESGRVPPLAAAVNPPYATSFGRTDVFDVPNFKADFALNENRFRSVRLGDTVLERDRDYVATGPVLRFTPAFTQSLVDAKSHEPLTVSFTRGPDVVLALNADTTPGIRLANGRRDKLYANDEMMLPYGYRENDRITAVGGAYRVTFYDDWLFRGSPTTIVVKDGETRKLPSRAYKSFRLERLSGGSPRR